MALISKRETYRKHLQIMELHDLGLTKAQIAEQLGVSVSNVYWHLKRGMIVRERRMRMLAGFNQQEITHDA